MLTMFALKLFGLFWLVYFGLKYGVPVVLKGMALLVALIGGGAMVAAEAVSNKRDNKEKK